MRRLDPEDARDRIAKLYAAMPDTELEGIVAAELTEVARQALKDELTRRTLKVDDVEVNTGERDSVELVDLVSIRQSRDLNQALLAKGALDSAGIECGLVDDNLIRMAWFYSNLLGGVKLRVYQEDAEAALDILEQPIPEEFEVEGVEHYEQPRRLHLPCGNFDANYTAVCQCQR